ncbi:MAG TPA: DUF3857 domain-containing protein [Candidatus Polarisedimenticolaceae bacterium]|nr:DUF3857 domain-containing protein [Candidatus Polarisedimenticolaceae bacterium]
MRITRHSHWAGMLCVPVGLLLSPCSGHAASKTDIEVVPGPAIQSEAERAIQPDPAAGAEHAVVLVEETERDDSRGTETVLTYHRRAKILSNEGRELANVELPLRIHDTRLQNWWGRTILPDGKVLELPQTALQQQSLARVGSEEHGSLKAALPGVVPGAVIDYGYTYKQECCVFYDRVLLQESYPIREFRYRWRPTPLATGAWLLPRAEALGVTATRDRKSILVTAHNLPAVVAEPQMPADYQVRAATTFYYLQPTTDFEDFWKELAKQLDRYVRVFNAKQAGMRGVIDGLKLPADADLEARLRAAYDWIATNLENTSVLSLEQLEEAAEDDVRNTAEGVLQARRASGPQLDRLFIGMARMLGAEAYSVFATDRSRRTFEPDLHSAEQFDLGLVAVHLPDKPADAWILTDAGSGLPFGEIPWWTTGVYGFLATPSGGRKIFLPAAGPAHNVATTTGALKFTGDNDALHAQWAHQGIGQVGYVERRTLRGLTPDERQRLLDSRCGAGPDVDVLGVEATGIDDLVTTWRLSCETERSTQGIEAAIGRYTMDWGGPWLEYVPQFPPGPRHHPVVFDYPYVQILQLDVAAPQGFVPSAPPPPVKFSGPYGRYELSFTRTDDGFTVHRSFALLPLAVPAAEYDALRGFLDEVRKADDTAVVFQRPELGS